MTDPDYTAIMLVLDRSGSMDFIRAATEEAVNGFVAEQAKLPGRATIAIAQFDNAYEIVNASIPAGDVPKYILRPRGSTALLDAIGRAITDFGDELSALPEAQRPGNVVLAIMTDGYENASHDWTYDRIEKLVTQQQDVYGWNILYLGANQDAIATGAKMGMRMNSSITYDASYEGTQSVVASASAYTANTRSGLLGSFTDEDRKAATGGAAKSKA
jgi:hypothetical protein